MYRCVGKSFVQNMSQIDQSGRSKILSSVTTPKPQKASSGITIQEHKLLKILTSECVEPLSLQYTVRTPAQFNGGGGGADNEKHRRKPATNINSPATSSLVDNSDENMPPQDFIAHNEGYLHFDIFFFF